MFMDEDSTTVKKTSLQPYWQQSYSYTCKCIPPAQNSLGCCLHHTYIIASSISSSDVNVQLLRAMFNGQKMGKLYGDGSRLHAVCQRAPPITWHSAGPGLMSCSRMIPGICSWSWYTPFEVFDSNNVVTWFEIQKQGSSSVPLVLFGWNHHLIFLPPAVISYTLATNPVNCIALH
jgi:hypothetical protein